jgi:hypothetical protein
MNNEFERQLLESQSRIVSSNVACVPSVVLFIPTNATVGAVVGWTRGPARPLPFGSVDRELA